MQTEISKTAHTVIIVLQPESGDIIQAMKSGLMEIGDIFAVNKSDLRNAIKTENDLAEVLSMIHTDKWTPRIVKTVATKGRGIAALASCIEEHRRYLASSGEMLNKQNEIARYEVEKLLEYEVKKMVAKKLEGIKVQSIIQDVIAKRISAYDAAMKLMDEINEG
jgi:LAO/AO transport system kinase